MKSLFISIAFVALGAGLTYLFTSINPNKVYSYDENSNTQLCDAVLSPPKQMKEKQQTEFKTDDVAIDISSQNSSLNTHGPETPTIESNDNILDYEAAPYTEKKNIQLVKNLQEEKHDLRPMALEELKSLSLSGVMLGSNPIALINNKMVKIGTLINGYKVIAIKQNSVTLLKYGVQVDLTIKAILRNNSKNKHTSNAIEDHMIRDKWKVAIENIMNSPDYHGELIKSNIYKYYWGWSENRIYELRNNQLYRQVSKEFYEDSSYQPRVVIYKTKNGYRMKVCGVEEEVSVEQIVVHGRSEIKKYYGGIKNCSMFKLKNGQVWRKESDLIVELRNNTPDVLWFNESNNYYFMLRDTGEVFPVTHIKHYVEAQIVDYFEDIEYNQIIQLNNEQTWVQLDIGNTNYCLTYPDVLIYKDNEDEYQLVFEKIDIVIPVRKTIGVVKRVFPQ